MKETRRSFLLKATAAAAAAASAQGAGYSPAPFPFSAAAMEPIERAGPPQIKISCCAYSLRRYLGGKNPSMTMEDFLTWAAEVGLRAVELTSYYFPPNADEAYFHRIRRKAFLLGLDISGTAVGNNFCVPPGPQRENQIALVKKWIDRAALFAAPCIRIFAGGAPRGVDPDQARKWVVECIEECCAYAAQHGVMLALENHGGVVADSEGVLKIVRAVKSPWFGLNLDTGNFRTEDPYADIERVAPYAITSHIKVMVAPRGKPAREADFERIFSIFRKVGYRGYASLEYEGRKEPKADARKYIKLLQKLAGENYM